MSSSTNPSSTRPVRTAPTPRGATAITVCLDLVLVALFAVLGRSSHAEGLDALGIVSTAWPFAVGALVGSLVVALQRRSPTALTSGVIVWLLSVAGGMALRRLSGAGTDPAFVVVATLVLGALLIGSRVVVGWVLLRRRRRSAA